MSSAAREASPKQEGLKGFGNSSPCHASGSLSPIRFAEEERRIGPTGSTSPGGTGQEKRERRERDGREGKEEKSRTERVHLGKQVNRLY